MTIDYELLQFGWFTIFVLLLTGYSILDGFDLGVGMLHLFAKKDQERRVMLNAIGPVWDGNEVWLVTAGGALLAGFPDIYATIFSAFYVPMMVLLGGLIFRAISIEFRSKQPMAWWRWTWDLLFSLGSLTIAFILGFVLGNLIQGIRLDENKEFIGTFDELINPYACLVGLFAVALYLMHGAIYLLIKTEGELHDKLRKIAISCVILFTLMYMLTTMITLIFMPHMIYYFQERPYFFIIALINMLAVANIPREIVAGRDARAFFSSCINIVCLLALYAIGTYPDVVLATNNPDYSLTIYNSSSSMLTLKILFIIAFIGMPLVLAYTAVIHYIFRGKVKLSSHSY